MKNSKLEIAVGAFVLFGVALILFGVFTIRGMGLTPTETYHAVYRNVNTIDVGAAVKYNGKLVGRVEAVNIDPDDGRFIRVEFSLAATTPITDDLIAKITKADLLGDEYVDLRTTDQSIHPSGRPPVRRELPPGSRIEGGEPFDLQRALEGLQDAIGRVDQLISTVTVELEAALKKGNDILAQAEGLVSEDNQAAVKTALADLQATTGRLREVIDRESPKIGTILGNVEEASSSVSSAAGKIETSLDETLRDFAPRFHRLQDQLEKSLTEVQSALESLSTAVSSLDLERVDDLVENLELSSRHLAEFTREIKQRPSALIRKQPPPQREFRDKKKDRK
ncbi:MAG: MlaD family protein [Acidobacteriota bacterium]